MLLCLILICNYTARSACTLSLSDSLPKLRFLFGPNPAKRYSITPMLTVDQINKAPALLLARTATAMVSNTKLRTTTTATTTKYYVLS